MAAPIDVLWVIRRDPAFYQLDYYTRRAIDAQLAEPNPPTNQPAERPPRGWDKGAPPPRGR